MRTSPNHTTRAAIVIVLFFIVQLGFSQQTHELTDDSEIVEEVEFQAEAGPEDDAASKVAGEVNKMLTTPVYMALDSSQLRRMGPMYLSEKPMALVMSMVFPQPYEKAKATLDKETEKKSITIKERGEFKQNGKDILFQSGYLKKDGVKMSVVLYALRGDAERTIVVMAFYDAAGKKKYEKMIKNAAATASLTRL